MNVFKLYCMVFLRNSTKRKAIFLFCKEKPRINCFFLQEMHSTDNDNVSFKGLNGCNNVLVNIYGCNNRAKNKRLICNVGTMIGDWKNT